MTAANSSPRWLVPILAAILLLAYGPGLFGPFVLDDHVNLLPVWLWWADRADFASIFANPSGPLGRPLAIVSLALNALAGGQEPFGYKLFNLIVHAANTTLVMLITRRLLAGLPHGSVVALALTALWALHPQHVSAVLYVVQRMALLGATAQLAAVLVYVEARMAPVGESRRASLMLLVAFPAVLALGLLGKETAILSPLLCGALEVSLFATRPRTWAIRIFFAGFLLLPLLIGVIALAMNPERLTGGYAAREFDLASRLLTQPRVLLDYVAGWFWPLGDQLGLYRDGYLFSRGVFEPPSTAFAIVVVAGALIAAWCLRRRNALLSAGILWFFAAHALESSALALEPFFEHRNYVASLGLLLAAAGALRPVAARLDVPTLTAALLIVVSGLSVLTGVRAYRWGDLDRLLASEGPPPGEISRRLQIDRAIRGFDRGDRQASLAALAVLGAGNAGDRAAAALWRAILECDRGHALEVGAPDAGAPDAGAPEVGAPEVGAPEVDAGAVDAIAALRDNPPPVLTHSHVSWLALLAERTSPGRCEGLAPQHIEQLMQIWQRSPEKPATVAAIARLEAIRGRLAAIDAEQDR